MRCSECGENKFQETNGEIVCLCCGLVLDDNRIEQDTLLPAGRPAMHPALLEAGTFNTNGRRVRSSWLLTTKQKAYRAMCSEIDLLISRVTAPANIASEAKRIFLEVSHQDLATGRGNLPFAYAAVYLSCLLAGTPQTALELTAHTDVSKKELLSAARHIQRALKIRSGLIEAVDLIPRFATRLQLQNEIVAAAILIATNNMRSTIKPSTLAATSLYIAMQQHSEYRPQRLFTRYTGVIEVTLRRRSKQLLRI